MLPACAPLIVIDRLEQPSLHVHRHTV